MQLNTVIYHTKNLIIFAAIAQNRKKASFSLRIIQDYLSTKKHHNCKGKQGVLAFFLNC